MIEQLPKKISKKKEGIVELDSQMGNEFIQMSFWAITRLKHHSYVICVLFCTPSPFVTDRRTQVNEQRRTHDNVNEVKRKKN